MSREVQDNCIALIRNRAHDLEHLHIRWFGGEPLAASDVVERISGAIREIEDAHPDLNYVGSMTTNGYLMDAVRAARLVGLGIRHFQISLDGPRESHDGTRVMKNGRGSFEVIMANLAAIRASSLDLSILLRLHMTRENAASLPNFVREIARKYLVDPRFTLFLMPIAHLGGPNDAETEILSHVEAAELSVRLRAITAEVIGHQPSPPEGAAQAWSVCYAAKPNSFVIRADGSVGKCTVALSSQANRVGRLGKDGRVELDQDRHRPWLLGWETRNPDMLHCPMEAVDFLSN